MGTKTVLPHFIQRTSIFNYYLMIQLFNFRMDSEPGEEVQKLHGWVYTTDYRGTLIGEDMKIQVGPVQLPRPLRLCFNPAVSWN